MTSLKRHTRILSLALASTMAAGSLLIGSTPAAAESSREKIARVGTYALGAGTVYALAKKKGTLALIGAAGTYYAYSQWKNEKNKRNDRNGRRTVRRSRR